MLLKLLRQKKIVLFLTGVSEKQQKVRWGNLNVYQTKQKTDIPVKQEKVVQVPKGQEVPENLVWIALNYWLI